MIVPSARLLWLTAVAVIPLATLLTAVPELSGLAALALTALLAVTAADAVRGRKRMRGLSVQFPEIARLFKGRAGALEVQLRNEAPEAKSLRLGLAFPREIVPHEEEMLAVVPAGTSRLNWPCTAHRRGRYTLDGCYLEDRSPLGLWSVRTFAPAPAEIRVYPNLLKERRSVAALFLNRGSFGTHGQRQVGQGRDFEKLRDYIPGDPLEEIHWKATAKRMHPVTKMFQIERTQEVYVVIDASRLSARRAEFDLADDVAQPPAAERTGAAPAPQTDAGSTDFLERFISAALVLGLAAERQGDLFGVLTFADRVQTFLRASSGKQHFSACRDALYTLTPRMVTPDFEDLATFIRLRLRRRALLVFLTSLDDPVLSESFVRNIGLLCRHHLVLVNMPRPSGVRPLFTAPDVKNTDEIYGHLAGHLLWSNLRELQQVLRRRGVQFTLLEDERLTPELISQYVSVKQRQLL